AVGGAKEDDTAPDVVPDDFLRTRQLADHVAAGQGQGHQTGVAVRVAADEVPPLGKPAKHVALALGVPADHEARGPDALLEEVAPQAERSGAGAVVVGQAERAGRQVAALDVLVVEHAAPLSGAGPAGAGRARRSGAPRAARAARGAGRPGR